MYYTEGQMVHKGDALIDIDPRPYQAKLTQAEGRSGARPGACWRKPKWTSRYQAA